MSNTDQSADLDFDEASSSSVSTSSESSVGEEEKSSARKTDFQYLVSGIFRHIRSLYKISALLRRPVARDKYIRSVSKDEAVSFYAPWDQAHLEDKFRGANQSILRRLAMANTRRRQQLKFWEKHPAESSEAVKVTGPIISHKPQSLVGAKDTTRSTNLTVDKRPTLSLGVPSQSTKQSFSTVAKSELNDNETSSGRPQTVYEPSTKGRTSKLRVPDRPKIPFGQISFDCPYCLTKLNVRNVDHRAAWK